MDMTQEMTPQEQFRKGRRKKNEVEIQADTAVAEVPPPVAEEQEPAEAPVEHAPAQEVAPQVEPEEQAQVTEPELTPEEAHKEAVWAGRLRKRAEELDAREAALNQREDDLNQREQTLTINRAMYEKESGGKMPSEKTVETQGENERDPLQRFSEDFGDDFVADLKAAIASEARNAVAEVGEMVKAELTAKLEQVVGDIGNAFGALHEDTIRGMHDDVDDITNSDEFKSWPESLPEDERAGMMDVIQHGTPWQVVKLLNKFKSRPKIGDMKQDAVDEAALAAAAGVRSINAAPNVGSDTSADPMSAFLRGRRSGR